MRGFPQSNSGPQGSEGSIMADTLNVKRREQLGTANNRRLRAAGSIPAVLYGHGEASLSLTVPNGDVMSVVKHGGKVVKLAGDVSDNALIRAVQWDVWGKDVLHLDLLRVSEKDKVKTKVTVELKGTAVGTTEGGVVEHVLHEVEIECPAMSIPDKLVLNITELHLNKSLYAKDIPLPQGATLVTDEDTLIVHCIPPHIEVEPVPAGEVSAIEPEIIGQKEKEEAAKAAAEAEGKK
jgi:large subunit ribosomal protein L25